MNNGKGLKYIKYRHIPKPMYIPKGINLNRKNTGDIRLKIIKSLINHKGPSAGNKNRSGIAQNDSIIEGIYISLKRDLTKIIPTAIIFHNIYGINNLCIFFTILDLYNIKVLSSFIYLENKINEEKHIKAGTATEHKKFAE